MRLSNDRIVITAELVNLRHKLKRAKASERTSIGVSIAHRERKLQEIDIAADGDPPCESDALTAVRASKQSFLKEVSRVSPSTATSSRTARVTIRAGGKTLASGTMELRTGVTVDELLDAEEQINAQTTLRVHFDVEG